MLRVVEIFDTIQGEGSQAGMPAVFVRLVGCNLWSGLEHLRSKGIGACAEWCDTLFHSGEKRTPESVVSAVFEASPGCKSVVITGGEPTLQLRKPEGIQLLKLLCAAGVKVSIETNGTQEIPDEVDSLLSHITCSPKPLKGKGGLASHIKLPKRGSWDLKVVHPTPFSDELLREWSKSAGHSFVQPCDQGPGVDNLPGAIQMVKRLNSTASNEEWSRWPWKLSIQTHKLLGLP